MKYANFAFAGLASLALAFGAMAQEQETEDPATVTDRIPASEEPEGQLLGGVAAVVNDRVISLSDVAQRARLLLVTLGIPATQENFSQALPRALEELIEERLQLLKSTEYSIEISDAEIAQAVGDIAQQNETTVPALYDSLQSAGVNPQTLEEQTRAEIAWRRIMGGVYGSRVRISKVQIDMMLERLENSADETRYQLSEIFIFAPTEADKQQAVNAANVIVEQLRQGARFQLAAQQYSNSPTAAIGGDMGWVSPEELDPTVRDALAGTTPPTLTSPIVVDDGVYIYAFRGRQDGFTGADELDLRQVLATDGDSSTLENFLSVPRTCEALEEDAGEFGELVFADLGKIPDAALTPDIRAAVENVETGNATAPIETASGPAVLFVCGRGQAGLELPSRQQIEDRLFQQQLTMLSQRALRDLKREATIIRR